MRLKNIFRGIINSYVGDFAEYIVALFAFAEKSRGRLKQLSNQTDK